MKFTQKLSSILFLTVTVVLSQEPSRYMDSLFSASQTHTDLIYASAPELNYPTYSGESSTHTTNLRMHIFQPDGDTASFRPMLIVFHSGAFISGSKENDDMLAFCRLFAEKGYVTATVQYRLGMNILSQKSSERAVYRAIQDSRAALRFVRGMAEELRIDGNRIYILGSSAGALITLHNSYMNKSSERPASSYQINIFPPTTDNGPDLGGLDAIGSANGQNAQANAIIPLWGALQDTSLIEQNGFHVPALLIHGTADNIVPFGVGKPFNLSTFANTYGSQPVSHRFTHLNYDYESYFVEGAGHEFYGVSNGMWNPAPNAYWDTVVTRSTNFLLYQHRPESHFNVQEDGLDLVFTDQSSGAVKWQWDFGDSSGSTEQNPVHQYNKNGTYRVTLRVYSNVGSWDSCSAEVNYTISTLGKIEKILTQSRLEQNYPNPFNPQTTITYYVSAEAVNTNQKVKLTVCDITGKEIKTLVSRMQKPGEHRVTFHAGDLSSGIYFYQLVIGENFMESRKMVLIR